jgi:Domain of unknown function (DUF5658)
VQTHELRGISIAAVRHMPMRQEGLVLVIFLVAQVLDGVLTYAGIRQLGLGVEANELLVFYIDAFGVGTALVGAKGLACACGLILYVAHYHRPLAVAAGAYLGVAVVPWVVVLSLYS